MSLAGRWVSCSKGQRNRGAECQYPALTLSDCVFCLACNNSTPQYVSSITEATYAYLETDYVISVY